MASNYPDDIHNFDNHPQSPFYVEPWPECKECKGFFEEFDMANSSLCKECDAEMRSYETEGAEG